MNSLYKRPKTIGYISVNEGNNAAESMIQERPPIPTQNRLTDVKKKPILIVEKNKDFIEKQQKYLKKHENIKQTKSLLSETQAKLEERGDLLCNLAVKTKKMAEISQKFKEQAHNIRRAQDNNKKPIFSSLFQKNDKKSISSTIQNSNIGENHYKEHVFSHEESIESDDDERKTKRYMKNEIDSSGHETIKKPMFYSIFHHCC